MSGSRLGGPHVPPSPSLRIHTGLNARILARLLHSLVRVSRRVECRRRLAKRPERREWTTSRTNSDRPRPLRAVTRRGRRANERAPAAKAAYAAGVEVPPLSSAGSGRSARSAISSPPPGGCATCPTRAPRPMPAALGRPESPRVQGCRRPERSVDPRRCRPHARPPAAP